MREIILGINGFSKRVHDSSACIVVDGNLVAMAEEERFTRRKNVFGQLPYNAISYCLHEASTTIDDLDQVAVGWNFDSVFHTMGNDPPTQEVLVDMYFPKTLFTYAKKPYIELIPHHKAHAASSYFLSGYEKSLVFVIDGQGEAESTSIFEAKGEDVTLVKTFSVKDSLGYFYEAVSEFVGLSRLEAGKTMGLASYGSPLYDFSIITLDNEGYSIDINQPVQQKMDLQEEITAQWKEYFKNIFGLENKGEIVFDPIRAKQRKTMNFEKHYKNVASSAQQTLEKVVTHLIDVYGKNNPNTNLCIAGGVGLNCSMNGAIARKGIVKNLFIPPFSNDAGVSVGAALYISDKKPHEALTSAALGPSFSDKQILDVIKSLGIAYRLEDDIGGKVAKLIANGNIVDWFQGRMEAGPRALGNRSILGDPRRQITHERLNLVKNREQWRPLAPSFLVEKVSNFMEDPSESPFMLRAFLVKPDMKDAIPAAVHIDRTSRAQTVTEFANPLYYRLIQEFEKNTGIPAVMNTSFNLDFEPIVCSPFDAVRTFFSSRADYLAIGNVLISKR